MRPGWRAGRTRGSWRYILAAGRSAQETQWGDRVGIQCPLVPRTSHWDGGAGYAWDGLWVSSGGRNAESSSSLLQRLSMGMSDGGASDPTGGRGGLLHPVENFLQASQIVTADVPSRSIPQVIASFWRCLPRPGLFHPVVHHADASRVLWIGQSVPVGRGDLMAGGGRGDLH